VYLVFVYISPRYSFYIFEVRFIFSFRMSAIGRISLRISYEKYTKLHAQPKLGIDLSLHYRHKKRLHATERGPNHNGVG